MSLDDAAAAAFQRFDVDNSGTIDSGELLLALRAVGLVVEESQVGYMLRKYDDDRNATLDIFEFGQLCADLQINSPESVQARLGLRTHPVVLEALESWWDTALRSMASEQREASKLGSSGVAPRELNRSQYMLIMRKIFKAMMNEWDEGDAMATAEEDWEHDRRGMDTLSADVRVEHAPSPSTSHPPPTGRMCSPRPAHLPPGAAR